MSSLYNETNIYYLGITFSKKRGKIFKTQGSELLEVDVWFIIINRPQRVCHTFPRMTTTTTLYWYMLHLYYYSYNYCNHHDVILIIWFINIMSTAIFITINKCHFNKCIMCIKNGCCDYRKRKGTTKMFYKMIRERNVSFFLQIWYLRYHWSDTCTSAGGLLTPECTIRTGVGHMM